jgi:hypothetical protein
VAAGDLISVSELKEYLALSGSGQDTALGNIIVRESAGIEAYLDRVLVTTGNLTEYHLGAYAHSQGVTLGPHIYTRQWPLISITSIHESDDRTYDATTLLAASSYVSNAAAGRITRVGGSTDGPEDWTTAYRGLKVIYAAGYANTAAVPAAIKDVCLRLCALAWSEVDRKQHGVNSVSDALGNVTRFSAARLSPDMKDALAPYARREFIQTGEE